MRVIKSKGTVTLPHYPSGGSITRWAREAMTTLQQLRDRVTVIPPAPNVAPSSHPFKISVVQDTGAKLQIYFGTVVCPLWVESGGGAYMTTNSGYPSINAGGMEGAPGVTTPAQISLSDSTTYGVWLKMTLSAQSNLDTPDGGTYSFLTHFANRVLASQTEVVVSSTYTTEEQGDEFTSAGTGYAYVYIGKVVIDADSKATITQWLRSDLVIPWSTLPDDFISNDADNSITAGTDGALYVDDTASVKSLTGGTDIGVVDNGSGSWTINYTG